MISFDFKVIPDSEDKRIPICVAGKVMVEVQSLVSHIGEYLIAKELRIQYSVPEELLQKFILRTDGGADRTVSSSVESNDDYSGALMDSALKILEDTLDALNYGPFEDWMTKEYPDPKYRKMVAEDLLALSEDIRGFTLVYGSGNNLKKFTRANDNILFAFTTEEIEQFYGITEGGMCKSDADIPNPFFLSSGESNIRLTLNGKVTETEAANYLTHGPCMVAGTLVYSEEGLLTEVKKITKIDYFPFITFNWIISPEKDMVLKNPVKAKISYDGKTRTWTLESDLLGISVSKQDWDSVVREFHNDFEFLWYIYAEESGENLNNEEAAIREYLLSLMPESHKN